MDMSPVPDAAPAKTLVLVRHAKSSWDLDVEDHERPLSGRGRRDARAVGELLVDRSIIPGLVLCSTALRTQQTWAGAMAGGATAGEVRLDRRIYQAWVPELLRLVRATPEDISTLLILGHAPGIPDLVEHLAMREHGSALWTRLDAKFPTAAVAVLDVARTWAELGQGRAHLAAFEVPRARA